MSKLASDVLMLLGAMFLLLAAVGVLRMPDLYTRMQAASKASTLGIGCVLLALAFDVPGISINIRVLATIAFFFLTAPVTAHLIGRASYIVGVPLWRGSVINELKERSLDRDRRPHPPSDDSEPAQDSAAPANA